MVRKLKAGACLSFLISCKDTPKYSCLCRDIVMDRTVMVAQTSATVIVMIVLVTIVSTPKGVIRIWAMIAPITLAKAAMFKTGCGAILLAHPRFLSPVFLKVIDLPRFWPKKGFCLFLFYNGGNQKAIRPHAFPKIKETSFWRSFTISSESDHVLKTFRSLNVDLSEKNNHVTFESAMGDDPEHFSHDIHEIADIASIPHQSQRQIA